jgi:hypothetical protein
MQEEIGQKIRNAEEFSRSEEMTNEEGGMSKGRGLIDYRRSLVARPEETSCAAFVLAISDKRYAISPLTLAIRDSLLAASAQGLRRWATVIRP